MKKFIGNFMGMDIFLDDEMDKDAIELIEYQRREIEAMRGDSVDASMYRYIQSTIDGLH